MAAGEARRLHEETGRPVVIVDSNGRPRWCPLWDGIPYLVKVPAGEMMPPGVRAVVSGRTRRPYVARWGRERTKFRDYRPTPAEISLPPDMEKLARHLRGVVLVEPHIKTDASPNKQWGFDRWQRLVGTVDLPWLQLRKAGDRRLAGIHTLDLDGFLGVLAAMKCARGYVGPEGGMHHAAAAFGRPAVVLYGHYISPRNTGYDYQTNLAADDGPCGWRAPCGRCAEWWDALTVEQVAEAVARTIPQQEETAA